MKQRKKIHRKLPYLKQKKLTTKLKGSSINKGTGT